MVKYFKVSKIRSLEIKCNHVSEIPNIFENFKNLVSIDFCFSTHFIKDKSKKYVPDSIRSLPNLKELTCSWWLKVKESTQIPNSSSIEKLTCDFENDKVPSEIRNMKELNFLFVISRIQKINLNIPQKDDDNLCPNLNKIRVWDTYKTRWFLHPWEYANQSSFDFLKEFESVYLQEYDNEDRRKWR